MLKLRVKSAKNLINSDFKDKCYIKNIRNVVIFDFFDFICRKKPNKLKYKKKTLFCKGL